MAQPTVLPDGAHNYYLGTDLGVLCYTEAGEQTTYSPEYQRVRSLASLAIALYPVGVPVAYAVLLFWCYGELRTGRPIATLARALRFLHREYMPQLFWWELVVVAKSSSWSAVFAARPRLRLPGCGRRGNVADLPDAAHERAALPQQG